MADQHELYQLTAKRWRQTKSQRKRAQRQAEKNKKYRKVPVEITQQPKKTRKVYMGRVSYEWKSGPNRGKKVSIPITLKQPAKLTIRGRELMVKPRDGEAYIWGDKASQTETSDNLSRERTPNSPDARKREKRLRDLIKEKLDALIKERGPLEAGKSMAKGFVRAHNKMKGQNSKRALAKLYGVVMKTNKAAHRTFGRSIRNAKSVTKTVPVKGSAQLKVGDMAQHVLTDAPFKIIEIRGGEAKVEGERAFGLKHSYAVFPLRDLRPSKIAPDDHEGGEAPAAGDKLIYSSASNRQNLIIAASLAKAAYALDPGQGAEVSAFIKMIKKKLATRKAQKGADKYRKEKGKCPRGFRFSKEKGKCGVVSDETKKADREKRAASKKKKAEKAKKPVKKKVPVKKKPIAKKPIAKKKPATQAKKAPVKKKPTGKKPVTKSKKPGVTGKKASVKKKKKPLPKPVDFGDKPKKKPAKNGKKKPAKKAPPKKKPPAKAPPKKPEGKKPPTEKPKKPKKPKKTGKVAKGPLDLGILE